MGSTIFSCTSSSAASSCSELLLLRLADRADSEVATAQRNEEIPFLPASSPAANRLRTERQRFTCEGTQAGRAREVGLEKRVDEKRARGEAIVWKTSMAWELLGLMGNRSIAASPWKWKSKLALVGSCVWRRFGGRDEEETVSWVGVYCRVESTRDLSPLPAFLTLCIPNKCALIR